MPVLGLLVLVSLGLGFAWWVSRANELFCVSVRDGKCLVIRGNVPPNLLHGFADVMKRSKVERATIRGVRQGGRARLVATGVDEGVAQRLRNTFGASSWSKARFGTKSASTTKRNLGQLLGIAWLAWFLSGD